MGDPDDDVDNHAAMIGPSYRMIGPANRGTRVAQVSPGSGTPPRQTFIGRTLRAGIANAATAEARAVAVAQTEAEQLLNELRPFYAAHYGKYRGRGQRKPGDPVPIEVLGRRDFAASLALLDAELEAEERALITKYIPRYASERISGAGSGPNVTLIPVTSATRLTPNQLKTIRPSTPRTSQNAGGFYTAARDRIVLRVDQVDAAIIAHEVCHAYASQLWNELGIAISLQSVLVDTRGVGKERLSDVFFDVDEGVTSKLAQSVIDDWFVAPMNPGMHPRPPRVPSALVGYGTVRLTTAESFIGPIDRTLTDPGPNTFLAYFAGDLSFVIDENDPLESDIRCGRARPMKLRGLL